MTFRGLFALLIGGAFLITSMSTGGKSLYMLGLCLTAAWVLSLLTAVLAKLTCRVSLQPEGERTTRGSRMKMTLTIRLFCLIPPAPVSIFFSTPQGEERKTIAFLNPLGTTRRTFSVICPHAGVWETGAEGLVLTDAAGFFSVRILPKEASASVLVLPNPMDGDPLPYSPGEGETTSAKRSFAELSAPADVRGWQDGDELKRVHWKLSMRRMELMVHTYETPQRPDALMLCNFSFPAEYEDDLFDALTEGCAGVIGGMLEKSHPVRLALPNGTEITGRRAEALNGFRTALAKMHRSGSTDFAAFLYRAVPRMQRTGTAAVFSAELNAEIAEAVLSLSRLGTHIRFVLVSRNTPVSAARKLLRSLRSAGVETDTICLEEEPGVRS